MKRSISLRKKILIGLFCLGLLVCVWEICSSRNPYLLDFKYAIKYDLLGMTTVDPDRETQGLGENWQRTRYENGSVIQRDFDTDADCKAVYRDGNVTRLVNYLDGYQMDMPGHAEFDFSRSPLYTIGRSDRYDVTISREKASYQSLKDVVTFELSTFAPFLFEDHTVEDYVNYYEYRFLMNSNWQVNNRVNVTSWTTEQGHFCIQAEMEDLEEDLHDGYLYVTCYTGSREYLRIMFRYQKEDTATYREILRMTENIRWFDPVGTGCYSTDYRPDLTEVTWTEETRELYDSLTDFSSTVQWGIFMQDFVINGFDGELPKLEEKLDYRFPVVSFYRHMPTHVFPTEIMETNYADGRVVELTLQLTGSNNLDLYDVSPMMEIYRGNMDAELRQWARAAADFGHPFYFRLNNEMNSDWTSYSGVVNMCDPQIYIAVWQRIYQIFREEGADNCIWIYNPNDRPSPPSKWNHSLAYYPGNRYTQIIGVTGYNNGTYYTQWAEEWREFDQIYDMIWEEYTPHFSEFPWIITEFASSSIGGDKAAWIENMFRHMGDYPNIRVAVWFSHADVDAATGNIARPYWLDETEQTTQAFRQGLQAQRQNGNK